MPETIPDPWGAFCTHDTVTLPGAAEGPLTGLRFAAKDLFDIAGHVTGAGNPDWLRTHAPARITAPTVQRLADAGATLVGKTQTVELAYALDGHNIHYGTPVNPRAPDRLPGGSSSGSAAAVAGGLVDFALGTDTGGSVRIPASFCGLYGIRTTHGRILLEGVVPLAPSFDVVGWFARDPQVFERIGHVLLNQTGGVTSSPRLLIAEDAFELIPPEVSKALMEIMERVSQVLGPMDKITLSPDGLENWMHAFRLLQGREIWQTHGEWITRNRPQFGPGVKERFEWTATLTDEDIEQPAETRRRARVYLQTLLARDTLVCLPTAPGIAPAKNASGPDLDRFRSQAMSLTSPAGLAGLPQVSLPLAELEGCPLGLSLLGGKGRDALLLHMARQFADIVSGRTG